ncbi:MAG: TIGR02569 family protein [Propionibacteriales bacterium]|nr:TIGR02569 family protein [Propionibacteriales bacterium]
MDDSLGGRNAASSAGTVRLLDAEDGEWRQHGPTPRAVRGFGVRDEALRRLPGGAGHAWTDGRLVLKPVGCVPEHAWVCQVYAAWTSQEVRVPEPVAPQGAGEEGWSADGWGAHVFLPGRDVDLVRELGRVRHASDAFHDSVKALPRPEFMDTRDDPWAFGDRLAWDAAQPEGDSDSLEVIEQLRGHLAPVSSPEQVIHGDILPNVLVADGLPPAIIDWPPYFRPAALANAIAVTDAVTFRDAPLSLLDEWATGQDWNQLLVRALLYRLGPTGLFASRNRLMGSLVTHLDRARPIVDAVLSR